MDEDDDKPRLNSGLPKDLTALSVAELENWISALSTDVDRARVAIAAKQNVRCGADALFNFGTRGAGEQ